MSSHDVFARFQFTRARGARPSPKSQWNRWSMFQFTRARGARQSPPHRLPCCRSFNSRAHGARDRAREAKSSRRQPVSIHARTGRATIASPSTSLLSQFQFTRARGARRLGRIPTTQRPSFQFTRARGARPCRGLFRREETGFNSRAHGARDGQQHRERRKMQKFQFTRARGARRDPAPRLFGRWVSIHARTGRATGERQGHGLRGGVSIHARTGRATSASKNTRPRTRVSIHARTGRATVCGGAALLHLRVSIHARTGRATCWAVRSGGRVGFQFTRARGARPDAHNQRKGVNVSIHARTGRATRLPVHGRGRPDVSIHARTGRATAWLARMGRLAWFQFTRARGARPGS